MPRGSQPDHEHLAAAGAKPPMHAAMLIPNPLLPADFFNRQEVDDFVTDFVAAVEPAGGGSVPAVS